MSETEQNASELYEERAAIIEYSGLYPRREAERIARAEVANWLKSKSNDEDDGND
jgi:pyruvoyl-dependent arginine decarboxylase (PvlArgDC)